MPTIYKYLPPERSTYFADHLLRFTQPGALNDPYECQPALAEEVFNTEISRLSLLADMEIGLAGNRQEKRKARRENQKRTQKLFRQVRTTDLSAKFYSELQKHPDPPVIMSLSRRWNSALMWAHYATSHSGFCLGFRRNHKFFNILTPVMYLNQRPKIMSAQALSTAEHIVALCTKSPDWRYEEEERLVCNFDGAKTVIDCKPYPIALFEVPHDALAEIILGIRIDRDTKKVIMKAAARLKVPVYQAKLSKYTYDVDRSKLEP